MSLNESIEKFEQISSEDVRGFLSRFVAFMSESQQKLIDFYSGRTEQIDEGLLSKLNALHEECESLLASVDTFSEKSNQSILWEVVTFLEDIETKIAQTKILPRIMRSSVTKTGNKSGFYKEIIVGENETIEHAMSEVAGSQFDDAWRQVAIDNDLEEQEYGEGPTKIKVRFSGGGENALRSVVDVIDGKTVYGKDLDKNISFEGSDLKTLSPDDTIKQAVGVLAQLSKGSIPEHPDYGMDIAKFVGASASYFSFPSIMRQLSEVFARDDTVKSVAIQDMEIEKDSFTLYFNVQTLLDDEIEKEIAI